MTPVLPTFDSLWMTPVPPTIYSLWMTPILPTVDALWMTPILPTVYSLWMTSTSWDLGPRQHLSPETTLRRRSQRNSDIPSSAIILMHSVPGKVPMRPLRKAQQSPSQNFCVLLKESSQSGLLWLMDVHLKHPRPPTETRGINTINNYP